MVQHELRDCEERLLAARQWGAAADARARALEARLTLLSDATSEVTRQLSDGPLPSLDTVAQGVLTGLYVSLLLLQCTGLSSDASVPLRISPLDLPSLQST